MPNRHEEDQGFCVTCGTDLNDVEEYIKITTKDGIYHNDESYCKDCIISAAVAGDLDD